MARPAATAEAPRKRSAHDRAAVTESMEDYLECIFDLESTKGYACVSDVAETLQLNRASTSIMVQRLGKLGFLRYEPYRGFALTPEGRRVAERIRKRHAIICPTSRDWSIISASAPSAASPTWPRTCAVIRCRAEAPSAGRTNNSRHVDVVPPDD
jgi:Iron dependent repressor, N-terminal DNA binding domain